MAFGCAIISFVRLAFEGIGIGSANPVARRTAIWRLWPPRHTESLIARLDHVQNERVPTYEPHLIRG
jgi:hypothetical protein